MTWSGIQHECKLVTVGENKGNRRRKTQSVWRVAAPEGWRRDVIANVKKGQIYLDTWTRASAGHTALTSATASAGCND
jgi:hypothetical protein